MKKFIIPALVLMPALAHAQLENIEELLESIGDLVSVAMPIVLGLALLGFFWGLARFIFNAGNEDAKDEGKRIMIWGIVAFFVMVSVWGLVGFIGEAIGVGEGSSNDPLQPTVPEVPGLD